MFISNAFSRLTCLYLFFQQKLKRLNHMEKTVSILKKKRLKKVKSYRLYKLSQY